MTTDTVVSEEDGIIVPPVGLQTTCQIANYLLGSIACIFGDYLRDKYTNTLLQVPGQLLALDREGS